MDGSSNKLKRRGSIWGEGIRSGKATRSFSDATTSLGYSKAEPWSGYCKNSSSSSAEENCAVVDC